ncbi:hypothetical protein PAMP_019030 [Pampus punctatissimus]
MAPQIQLVAYTVLPSETVIAHKAEFSTEKCFSHKVSERERRMEMNVSVSLEFSQSSAVPGEESTIQLTAQPNSLCGVSAVDQSVLIKERRNILDIDKNVGLKMATNLLIQMPSCFEFEGKQFHRYEIHRYPMLGGAAGNPGNSGGPPPPIVTVRSFFPETWIWDLVEVGESGTKNVSFTVPDTITTWETEAFCLSPQGFGLAPRKELIVFQPFFLELSLPYSIIRGEHFELKATVFNYLSSCIMVSVNPVDFTPTPHPDTQYTSCVCGNERKTFSWTMVPSALGVINVSVQAEAVASHASCDNEIVSVPDRGRIDVVTRSLIVKISLLYNIPTPTDVTTLSVEVKPEADCQCACIPKLTLKLKSLYSGKEDFTNMVILDIKMLSGFIPDPESLERLHKDIPINHSLELIQAFPVQKMKPALVKIYDYYQPSDHSETEYTTPCAAGTSSGKASCLWFSERE